MDGKRTSWKEPDEFRPPLRAKFNDAIKIWRSLDKANPAEENSHFLVHWPCSRLLRVLKSFIYFPSGVTIFRRELKLVKINFQPLPASEIAGLL